MIVDPNAVLERIIDAALDGDAWTLREASEELVEWLEKDGAPPTEARVKR